VLDAGPVETLLATNRYLLEHGMDNSAETLRREGVVINHRYSSTHGAGARLDLGQTSRWGRGCRIEHSIIRTRSWKTRPGDDIILDSSLVGAGRSCAAVPA